MEGKEALVFRRVFLISVLVPALFMVSGNDASAEGGSAAYYSSSYSVAWWESAMRKHASWGNNIEGWQYDPNGYYCVRPGVMVGERLWLRNSAGEVVACTVGDTVQVAHQASWWSKWVIEVNWPLFTRLGLENNNYVEVFFAPPERQVNSKHFEETGHYVNGEFLAYWSQFGDFDKSVEIFGYPISGAYIEGDTGMMIQKFERVVMEYHQDYPEGERVLLRRVVAESTS